MDFMVADVWRNLRESIAFERLIRSLIKNRGTGVAKYMYPLFRLGMRYF